jgi:hypothetical protein
VTETSVFELTQPETFSDPLTEDLRNGARTLLGQAVEAEVAASTRLDEAKTAGMGHSRILPTTGQHRDWPRRTTARPAESAAGHLACLYVEWAAVSRSGQVCVGPRRRCTAPNRAGFVRV